MAGCALGALSALAGHSSSATPVELSLQGVVRVRGGQYITVLGEANGPRRLPVPVTRDEASLIEHAARGPGSLTSASLDALGGRVLRASIDGVSTGGRLRAKLLLKSRSGQVPLDAARGG